LLGLNRTTLYYKPVVDEKDIQIKANIDKIYTANPELGHIKVAIYLEKEYGITLDRRTALKHMQED